MGRAKGNGCRRIVDYLNGSEGNKNFLNSQLKVTIEKAIHDFSLQHPEEKISIVAIENGTLSIALDGENPVNSGSWKYQGFYEFPEEHFDFDACEEGLLDSELKALLKDLDERGIFDPLNKTSDFRYQLIEHKY
ncbi:hypothetical protein LEP1GSC060_0860 [Leptospira weilii serovar Ranarum str. ICFT]|uniref:Uncharacterized protein n=1 Tax=Leptospira weilii serovar Ranarum str. ICFT TaxID=1218598 RepID=N1WSX3_9LEPT|nr:hypothetical protein [Leptospira weilii]EMY78933.1 hypothetical protein LEP1GSC060_0860 [Leptospira weilii serovar Ranarum str. ICFT]